MVPTPPFVQATIENYFAGLTRANHKPAEDESKLTQAMANLLKQIMNFGFYDEIDEIQGIASPITLALDSRPKGEIASPKNKRKVRRVRRIASRLDGPNAPPFTPLWHERTTAAVCTALHSPSLLVDHACMIDAAPLIAHGTCCGCHTAGCSWRVWPRCACVVQLQRANSTDGPPSRLAVLDRFLLSLASRRSLACCDVCPPAMP